MSTTTAQLEQLFDRCNRKYFDGALPRPVLKVSRARTRLGQMACRRVPGARFSPWSSRKPRFSDFSISISGCYDLTDDELEDVMVHEMIHYSIAYSGLVDTAPHGTLFRTMMADFNERFGRHIAVTSHKRRPAATVQPSRPRLVLLMRLTRGRHFVTVVNRSHAGRLEEQLARFGECLSHVWFETLDPHFATFPQVRTLRGRLITREEYERWLRLCGEKGL